MNFFPNADFPISHEDRAEILAIYIALMEERDAEPLEETESPKLPLFDPPSSLRDPRSKWGTR